MTLGPVLGVKGGYVCEGGVVVVFLSPPLSFWGAINKWK